MMATRTEEGAMADDYDELSMFHENCEEHGIAWRGQPVVVRQSFELADGRRLSGLRWGEGEPELVLLHGGAQNAHTWDTVALALDRPLLALDLPGHGHSDPGRDANGIGPWTNAEDVAQAIRAGAPQARLVVGMSLGGLTTLALTQVAPELVARVLLVDVTPGVDREKSQHIADFVNGPATFASFDELLERTIAFNPTRSVSSLRRGILHNAVQLDDGTWAWRYARHRAAGGPFAGIGAAGGDAASKDLGFGDLWEAVSEFPGPLCEARGMAAGSVVGDDDVAELLRRRPDARVVEFAGSGHSIQGDEPVALAHLIVELLG
jgi:pimeloyl-ACP methyl ester carboxylesterase